MAEFKTLQQIAEERGEELHILIPRVIAKEGSIHKAAVALGVYPNTIHNWLRTNKLRVVKVQNAKVIEA